jgi:hypothetical protein
LELAIVQKASNLATQLNFGGFTVGNVKMEELTKSVTMDVKECFDGVWQLGVEVTSEGFYVYRKLVEPLLDDGMMMDSDMVIDFATPSASSVIGFVSNTIKMKGAA